MGIDHLQGKSTTCSISLGSVSLKPFEASPCAGLFRNWSPWNVEFSDLLQLVLIALLSALSAAVGGLWRSIGKDIERLEKDIKDLRRVRHEHDNHLQRLIATLEFLEDDLKDMREKKRG